VNQYDSFAGSFTSGLRGALGVIDAVDQRKERIEDRRDLKSRQKKLDEKNELLWNQQQQDRARNLNKQEKLDEREETEWGQQQKDRELKLQDDQLTREHLEKLRPSEINLARARASGAYKDIEIADYELRQKKNAERRAEAQRQIAQVATYAEAGNYDAAREAAQGLEAYGFDMPNIESANRSQEIINITSKVMQGEIPISSPEASDALRVILKPALNLSGRAADRFEFDSLEKTDKGTFKVHMRDKENGRKVPATLIASDKDHDLLVELTPLHLAQAVKEYTSVSMMQEALMHQSVMTEVQATGNRAGMNYGQDPAMAKMQAEQQAKSAEQLVERFVGSFDPLDQGIAKAVASIPDFDPQQHGALVGQARALMAKNDDMTPVDAVAQLQNNAMIQERIEYDAANWSMLYPGLSIEKARKLATLRIQQPEKAGFVYQELERHQNSQKSRLARDAKRIDERQERANNTEEAPSNTANPEDIVPLRAGR
jgi:hypothetical protein